jgi:uncharacterized protein involved in type VI secretion and phage assembly
VSLFDRVAAWIRNRPATINGVKTATVVDHADPDGEGRVMIELDSDHEAAARQWARTATLMAGPDRGTWFIPDVGDEVLVAFEQGDPSRPFVVGALWSQRARPPEQIGLDNGRRTVATRNGARIVIDDTGNGCVMRLVTAHGQHVTLDDGPPSTISVSDNAGNQITFTAGEVVVSSALKLTLTASTVTVTAGRIAFETGMVDVSGVLKCDTMIANNVVGSNYTPGVGNIQ